MPHVDLAAAPVGAAMPPAAMDSRPTVVAGFAQALADAETATAPADREGPRDAEAVSGSPGSTRTGRGDVRQAVWNPFTRMAPQVASGAATASAAASAVRPAALRESTDTPASGAMVRPQVEELVQVTPQTAPLIAPLVAPGILPIPVAVPAAAPPPPGDMMLSDSATGTGGIKPIATELLQPGGHAVSVVPGNAAGSGWSGGPGDTGVGTPQIPSAPGIPVVPGMPAVPGLVEIDPTGGSVPGAAPPPAPMPGGPDVLAAAPPMSATGGGAPGVTEAPVPGVPMPSPDTRPAPGASLTPRQEENSLTASLPGRTIDAPERVTHGDARGRDSREGDGGDRSKDDTRLKPATSMNALARTVAARFKANEEFDAPVAPGVRSIADVAEPGRGVGRGARDVQAPMPITVPATLCAALPSVPPPTAIGATAGAIGLEGDRGQDLQSQIVQAMRVQASANGGDARIRLQPNYLGELTISLRVENGNVVAHLAAATPEVRQWIETNEATLRQGLALHDLKLERLVVTEDEPATASGGESDTAEQYERRQSAPRRRRRATDATFEVVV